MSASRARVLSIAGTDPIGGAGHAADLKAIAAMGGYGMSVITSVVAQNTTGVHAVVHLPPELIAAQLTAVFSDVEVDAIKIGMLGTKDTVEVVAAAVTEYRAQRAATGRAPYLVIDPVMVSSSGHRLLEQDCEDALVEFLSTADLITPNADELAALVQEAPPQDPAAAFDFGARLAKRLRVNVLVKGGHVQGERVIDRLLTPADGIPQVVATVDSPRQITEATHGTGCSMASALATMLARTGGDYRLSLTVVHHWLQGAIALGEQLQVGAAGTNTPVDHLAGVLPYPEAHRHGSALA